jgi:hypothetical protein
MKLTFFLLPVFLLLHPLTSSFLDLAPRPHLTIRGTYGVIPEEIFNEGKTLADYGINAVFLNSGIVDEEKIKLLRRHNASVFAEYNTMHYVPFLESNPDAAPIGPDGKVSPPPADWQGICPTHPGYRQNRMSTFRSLLEDFDLDGIWLDYHHAHASWERAEPILPDTCFCERCTTRFAQELGLALPEDPLKRNQFILDRHEEEWVQWRCDVFTDWVREFRQIVNETRPAALLGTFHCPWDDQDHDGALRRKLAIDLRAQAPYLDVFSPMPYHARFGHSADLDWISRQISWLGEYLNVKGSRDEKIRIWPIVQVSDWGEEVPAAALPQILEQGSRLPATGILVFSWGSFRHQREKIDGLGRAYRALQP